MTFTEQTVIFPCAREELLGIVAVPVQPQATGVLVVVGGPQTRVGSHRQFLLLSRVLAAAGYTAMRFDYRGMGDSTGDLRNFEQVTDDIDAAIDAFLTKAPWVKHIVLWGLCDAASAILLHCASASRTPRVSGLVLLNPWVRSVQTLARTQVKHYYGQRLLEREFWLKLMQGKIGMVKAITGFFNNLLAARGVGSSANYASQQTFPTRMAQGLKSFPGKALVILSGQDYTAKEFLECCQTHPEWQAILDARAISRVDVVDADHTFSSRYLRQQVEQATLLWLRRELESS